MEFKGLLAVAIGAVLCTSICCQTNPNVSATTTTAPTESENQTATAQQVTDDGTEFNQTEIILACNETFHTSMGWYRMETDKRIANNLFSFLQSFWLN